MFSWALSAQEDKAAREEGYDQTRIVMTPKKGRRAERLGRTKSKETSRMLIMVIGSLWGDLMSQFVWIAREQR